MEHFFTGSYLRVLKPVTVDGLNIAMDDNFRGQFKEVHLPLTAKADLELKNEKLPPAQKMRITVVHPNEEIVIPKKKAAPVQEQAPEEDEADNQPAPQPAKRGPKPKSHDLD